MNYLLTALAWARCGPHMCGHFNRLAVNLFGISRDTNIFRTFFGLHTITSFLALLRPAVYRISALKGNSPPSI